MKVVFLVFVLIFSFSSIANVAKVCGYCSSYSSFSYAAIDSAPLGGTVKVVNFNTGTIKTFMVERYFEPGLDVVLEAAEIQTSSIDISNTLKAHQNLVSVQRFFDANRDVPKTVVESGYSLIGDSVVQSKVYDYYNESQTLGSYWSSYTGAVVSVVGKIVDTNVVVNVRMSDGANAMLKINGINSDGDIEFVLIQLVDGDGNVIPLTQSEFEERENDVYHFSTIENLVAFATLAGRYGIEAIRVNSVPQGSVTVIDCSGNVCKTPSNPSNKDI